MANAVRDSYGVAGLLGEYEGKTIPIKATAEGKLCVSVEGGIGGGGTGEASTCYEYKLVKTMRIDLSTSRSREQVNIEFDYIAIADIQGNIALTIEEHELTINKCLGMDLTASSIQISNELQQGYCELWLFKKKKVTE